ncbi:MAG: dihydroorotate dehydrogenase electron transfer subunit [Actinomycetia bacterium]|nr:dihydroorotate dehydrogenase electron transfer subunit [Actinomycetes bacterium]
MTVCSKVWVIDNEPVADGLWRLTLGQLSGIEAVRPGQFIQLRLGEGSEHILSRPFAVSSATTLTGASPGLSVTFFYQVVGRGTDRLARVLPGEFLQLLGPLGNGWQPPPTTRRPLLIGGGVGFAQLNWYADFFPDAEEVHLLIGARNKAWVHALTGWPSLYGPEEMHDVDVLLTSRAAVPTKRHTATDNGELGHHGTNVELMAQLMEKTDFDYVAACGPLPMMRQVARLAQERNIYCEVSLESHMACGIGACMGCMISTTAAARRVCADGPVFNAWEVLW